MQEKVLLLPKQKGCVECYRDLEAMRRDAEAEAPKAKRFLKDLEKPQNEDDFYEMWVHCRRIVGPRCGKSRVATFKWMKFIEFYRFPRPVGACGPNCEIPH